MATIAGRQVLPKLGLGHDNKRIFWGMFFNEAAIGLFITLWPLYIAYLGASPPQIGLVIGLWGLLRLVFLLPSGMVLDRVRPRTIIIASRISSAIGLGAMSIAQEWWQLIPATLFVSLGMVAFPAISSVVADEAGRGRARIRAFTLIFTVGPSIALLIAPALSGVLAEQISLRAIFAGAALCNVAAGIVFSMITNREVTVQAGPPVTYRETLAHAETRTIALLSCGVIFTMVLGATLVPNYLQVSQDISVGTIGVLGSVAAVGSILMGMTITRVKIFGNPVMGIALAIASMAMMMTVLVFAQSLIFFVLAFIFRGGFFITFSLMYSAISEVAPDRLRTRAYILIEFMAGAGFSLAPFVAGWLFEFRPIYPMIAALILFIPLFFTALRLAKLIQSEDETTELARDPA